MVQCQWTFRETRHQSLRVVKGSRSRSRARAQHEREKFTIILLLRGLVATSIAKYNNAKSPHEIYVLFLI